MEQAVRSTYRSPTSCNRPLSIIAFVSSSIKRGTPSVRVMIWSNTSFALALARGNGRYPRLLKSLARVELLILDDWGLAPLTSQQGRDLLDIVDDRHGRGSTIVTSQIPVMHWHELIPDPTIADAVLDRLVHTAHRLDLDGPSLRAAKAVRTAEPDSVAKGAKK